ncbi:MAG: hypothetical protein K5668_08505 [Lachnospiraceae bacterium]|nr:hypothetical protein [Lachnospiraceae bacterium]
MENYGNMLQIIILCGCSFFAFFRMVIKRRKEWTRLFYFFGSFLLGDVYWQVCLLFNRELSPVALVADFCWYTSYVCLILLEICIIKDAAQNDELKNNGPLRFLPFLAPVFTGGMALFYITWGQVINNIIYAVLMGATLFLAITGLTLKKSPETKRIKLFCMAVLLYCFFEYSAWTVSCFSEIEIMYRAYVVFDSLMTLSFLLFIPATAAVVKED